MDRDAVEDLFAGILPIRVRRMFGGLGLFDGPLMFALVADGELYFKTNDETAALFAEAGGHAFSYARKGKLATMGYWTPPESIFDDAEELRRWTALALRVAHASQVGVRRRG